VFACLLQGAFSLVLGLPWAAYSTFVLEARHGFNKTSAATFCLDAIKSVSCSTQTANESIEMVQWPGNSRAMEAVLGQPWALAQCLREGTPASCQLPALYLLFPQPRPALHPSFLQALLGCLLLPPVVAGFTYILQKSSAYVGLYLWAFLLLISLCALTLYPTLIAPLFNKFTPLESGPLRDGIEQLAASLSFPLKKLFVVDGSTRSAHSNAYMVSICRVGWVGTPQVARFSSNRHPACLPHPLACLPPSYMCLSLYTPLTPSPPELSPPTVRLWLQQAHRALRHTHPAVHRGAGGGGAGPRTGPLVSQTAAAAPATGYSMG